MTIDTMRGTEIVRTVGSRSELSMLGLVPGEIGEITATYYGLDIVHEVKFEKRAADRPDMSVLLTADMLDVVLDDEPASAHR